MSPLKAARGGLVVSALIYVGTLVLGWLEIAPQTFWFLLGIVAIVGLVISAAACVLIQLRSG